MGKTLIGSLAAIHWFPDFPREPKDIDFVSDSPIGKMNPNLYLPSPIPKMKVEVYDNEVLLNWFGARQIASPDELYTIKVSHSHWNIHWTKTMFDIKFFQNKGCKLISELYDSLYKAWEIKHGKKKVYLNVENEKFFNEHVTRIVNHDWLHEQVMYYNEPMFNKIKKDTSKAMIDKDMFFALDYEDRIKTCREEIKVISVERHGIPNNFRVPSKAAYIRAAKDLITRMSKGWFPKFIVENWSVIGTPDETNYYKNIRENIN